MSLKAGLGTTGPKTYGSNSDVGKINGSNELTGKLSSLNSKVARDDLVAPKITLAENLSDSLPKPKLSVATYPHAANINEQKKENAEAPSVKDTISLLTPVNSPKSKKVDYKVEHPVFFQDEKGRPQISYIDQFPEPKNMDQGLFLQKLSDALEESNNKITFSLPVGSAIVANNYFWLHGRKPFKENKNLSRELLRIRGSFFNN